MVTDKIDIVPQVVVPFGMYKPALNLGLMILMPNAVMIIHEEIGCFYAHCELFSNQ
jgi:hypothetical protein